MIVYCWDTDGYAFESRELADGSPLPENGTLAPFPPLVGYQAARINAGHDAWDVVEDYFGALARDTATGEMYHITTRGPLPEGVVLVTEEELEAMEAAKALIEGYTVKVQQRLDSFAHSEGRIYDNIMSLCTYATSTNPVYSVEGQYGVQARDDTWEVAYAIMNDVLAGLRPVPTWEELEAELPVLSWPE